MNRRQCAIAALVMRIGIWSAEARGDATAPVAPAPAPTVTVPAPVTIAIGEYTSPTRAGIDAFVIPNVTNLMADSDPPTQTKARDNLSAATSPGGALAQPGFLLVYCQSLNAVLTAKLAPAAKATLRQRLNIAIVAQRVAAVSENAALQPTTLRLINDPAEPVVLWGMRAVQPQVKVVLNTRAPGAAVPPLIAAILPATLKHPSGPVYEAAYKALDYNDQIAVDQLMKLWGTRLAKYQEKAVPDDPEVDKGPVYTLSTATMWTTVVLNNKVLQTKIMQNLSDQLAMAAQWADKTPAGDTHDQLIRLTQQCSGAASVVGGTQKIPALVSAATNGTKPDPKSWPAGQKIGPVVAPILVEIGNAFKGVQPPPVVAGG